ncbi:Bacterial regulatory protein, luxR family [compost metagenome]
MPDRLSHRQVECLKLSAFMSDKEIGRKLGLSPHTVENHIREAKRKLGVSSRKKALELLTEFPSDGSGGMAAAEKNGPASGVSEASVAFDHNISAPSPVTLFDVYSGLGEWRTTVGWRGPKLVLIILLALGMAIAIGAILAIGLMVFGVVATLLSWR